MKSRTYIPILFVLVLAGVFGYRAISYVFAYTVSTLPVENLNDFVLEPGKAELFLNPGETAVRYISVTSRIRGTTPFIVEVEDFIGTRDPNQPVIILDNEASPYSSRDFIKPDTERFSLEFGQRIQIPVTISIPKDAPPGGYYSSVLVSNEPAQLDPGANVGAQSVTKVISRVGTLFFVRVNGEAKESGRVQDFHITPKQLFYQKGPFRFDILFDNDGNVHLVPYGTITIRNLFGKTVAELPVDAYFSLPNSLRFREVTWPREFLLGRYTAKLHLNKGYGNQFDERTIAFWVLPWKFIVLVAGILLVVILSVTYIVRKFEIKRK